MKPTTLQKTGFKWLTLLLPLFLVAIQWLTDEVQSNNLLYTVQPLQLISSFETPWLYMYLHLFTFVPILFLSFDKNVHYYTTWKYLLPAILPVAAFFILWDVFFTSRGIWGFNESYFLGIQCWNLPLEEWLFFFTVPFACVFMYECLNFYVKKDLLAPIEKPLTIFLIVLFILVGLINWGKLYTSTTFILAGGLLLYHYIYIPATYRARFYLAYIISCLPFFLVNGVLTGSYTQQPIVVYNPQEYLNIRLATVPLDDSIYAFLLLLSVISLYEAFQQKK